MKYFKSKSLCYLLLGILLFTAFSCQSEKKDNSTSEKSDLYKSYNQFTQKNIANFSPDRIKSREKAIAKLENTETYKILVDSNVVSPEYLPLLTAINDGIRSSYINENSEEMFAIDEGLIERVSKSEKGNDKLDFVINTVLLSLPNKGGIPHEIVSVFESFRKEYNYYGLPSTFHDMNGKLISKVEYPYNLSSIFGFIAPENRNAIEAIYEANEKNISVWFNPRDKGSYINSYTATIPDYVEFLSEHHKRSEYLPDDYSDDFWKNYDADLKQKIVKMIYLKDCNALQKQFDIAEQNINSQLARTGKGNSELMGFIDNNMRDLECYKK